MQPSLNDPDNHPADRPPDRPVIDLREVCCGLVPAILAELAKAQADEVDVQIRAGMETEIISGFGSGGNWQLCFQASFGFGLARFTRRAAKAGPKVRLDTLDY
jgi:hypothetical protein